MLPQIPQNVKVIFLKDNKWLLFLIFDQTIIAKINILKIIELQK